MPTRRAPRTTRVQTRGQDKQDKILISRKIIVIIALLAICVLGILFTSHDDRPDNVKAIFIDQSKPNEYTPAAINGTSNLNINLNSLISPTPGESSLKLQ